MLTYLHDDYKIVQTITFSRHERSVGEIERQQKYAILLMEHRGTSLAISCRLYSAANPFS